MSRELLEQIVRGEVPAAELGLPEPAPFIIELSDSEWVGIEPSRERLQANLAIALARTPTERWIWGLQWGQFIAAINPCKPRLPQAVIVADNCYVVAVREPEQ